VPVDKTDDTQCRKADNLFTSDLSTDYLHLLPDLHHIFVGLAQVEGTRIVTMASGEIHPIDHATEQPPSETSLFTATDKPHLSLKGGNNDVDTNPHEAVNKDDATNKKRKVVEAAPPSPKAKEPKPAPARDQIEGWIDHEIAVEQGLIRTGRKPYPPPLPNLYTEPELDNDLLDVTITVGQGLRAMATN
jgi:hypothetical protein